MNKADFDHLFHNSLHFDENTHEEIRRLGLVRQIPLFESFDVEVLKSIIRELEAVRFSTGEYFGEIALVMSAPWTATANALQPLQLLQLCVDHFNELL